MSMLEIELAAQLEEVRAERDALAAHVERLQSAVRAAKTPSGVIHVCETWMIDTHQTSLARLKAIARAEAMEWAAEKAAPSVAPWLKALARDYRRQAGEDA